MSEKEDEYPQCYDSEFRCWTDDCGGRYCSLRKVHWCEWFNEDECNCCPYLTWYED